MAFITYPLNNIDYTAEDAELFHCTRTSGIWAKDSFPISMTGADNNVTIGTGIAWINNKEFSGKVAALKSAEVLDLGIADSAYPRIDVIAIQYSANNNATDVVIKKGTPATNPVQPAIVRSGAVYELYLASVYRPAGATAITASNVTDLRMDETVCGLMADSITKVDMESINLQFKEIVARLEEEIQNISVGELVPIIKGGTGANNAKEALDNLGGVSITKLWENASPTSNFTTQTVSLDLSDYDKIEIIYRLNSSNAYCKNVSGKIASFVAMDFLSQNGSKIWGAYRTAQILETGVKFINAVTVSPSTVNDGVTNYIIPLAIYGIKGVQ